MIQGIEFKDLVTHTDRRGFFREVLRDDDPIFGGQFGQWGHSMMYTGVTKAWHLHKIQTDWWYVCTGVIRVGLFDTRPDSPTYKQKMDFLMGDHQPSKIVKIPPGVAHGNQVVQGPVNLFYLVSHIYNPEDELRIPFDDKTIGFDWLSGPPIK